jgi:hypothetical protein
MKTYCVYCEVRAVPLHVIYMELVFNSELIKYCDRNFVKFIQRVVKSGKYQVRRVTCQLLHLRSTTELTVLVTGP